VPAINKVGVGNTVFFKLATNKGASYTTSPFYGCTVVIIASGKGLIIGHYAEVQGKSVVLDNEAMVEENIILKLNKGGLDDYGHYIGDQAKVIIIHSHPQGSGSTGIGQIKEFLLDDNIKGNMIQQKVYIASSGDGEMNDVGKGKAVVVWASKEGGGAQMNIYVESDTPMYTQDFDAEGNPC
jgi:hypothetical protein